MLDANPVRLLTPAWALYAAIAGHRLQRRIGEPTGNPTTLGAGHHAHANALGLHHRPGSQ